MNLKGILFALSLAIGLLTSAQKFKTSESKVYFFSSAPIEDIEATNLKALSVMDLESGKVVFSVPVSQFNFDKSLMKEHFNENYLESDKYPKIILTGTMSTTNLNQGMNDVTVSGELNLHGVKKQIEINGTLNYNPKKIIAHAEFSVNLADYKIKIPKAVFYNIAEDIAITVDFTYEPY